MFWLSFFSLLHSSWNKKMHVSSEFGHKESLRSCRRCMGNSLVCRFEEKNALYALSSLAQQKHKMRLILNWVMRAIQIGHWQKTNCEIEKKKEQKHRTRSSKTDDVRGAYVSIRILRHWKFYSMTSIDFLLFIYSFIWRKHGVFVRLSHRELYPAGSAFEQNCHFRSFFICCVDDWIYWDRCASRLWQKCVDRLFVFFGLMSSSL